MSRTALGPRGGCTELPCAPMDIDPPVDCPQDSMGLSVSLQSPPVCPGVSLRATVGARRGQVLAAASQPTPGSSEGFHTSCHKRKANSRARGSENHHPQSYEHRSCRSCSDFCPTPPFPPRFMLPASPEPKPKLKGLMENSAVPGRLSTQVCVLIHTPEEEWCGTLQGFILLDLEHVSSHQLLVLTDQDVLSKVVPQPELGMRLLEGGRGRFASLPPPTPSLMPPHAPLLLPRDGGNVSFSMGHPCLVGTSCPFLQLWTMHVHTP